MKALLTAFLLAAAASAAAQGLERVKVSGADYVRLGEWAESNGFHITWRQKDDPIQLTNPSARLEVAPDSRKARICGATVWLSLPVVNRAGVALISEADVETALQPLLFPPTSRARVRTICLDPGHGGRDPGNIAGGNFEKKYTLLLALATGKLLREAGFQVVLTRTNDQYVDLQDRPALAWHAGADLFVSLHYNSGPRGLRGVEIHCVPPAGMKSSNAGGGRGNEPASAGNLENARNVLLAHQMLKSITAALPLEDLGVKRSHYEVLRQARMPAVLIEGGFMTDPLDAKNIYDPAFRQRMARSLVNGILAYQDAVWEKNGAAKPVGALLKLPGHAPPAPGRE